MLGMTDIVEEMLRRTKCLCELMDGTMVDEAFVFLEDNRIDQRPEKDEFAESVAEFMKRNRIKFEPLPLVRTAGGVGGVGHGGVGGGHGAGGHVAANGTLLQTPCSEFLSKVRLIFGVKGHTQPGMPSREYK